MKKKLRGLGFYMDSKTQHVLYGTLFVVEMYRWGDLDAHHYTAGIFDNEKDAKVCGLAERMWRGTKYEPVIYKHSINQWRNGNTAAMYKEFEDNNYHKLSIEDAWDKHEAYDIKEKREDPDSYFQRKAEQLREKYGPKKQDGRE